MNLRLFAFFIALLSGPAMADSIHCELPWFARNLIHDRAGFCFATPLGRAVFGNADCIGTDITLSERDRDAVARLHELEVLRLCSIDTNADVLEHEDAFAHLRTAGRIPIPVEHESGCISYLGPAQPLLSQPDSAGHLTGRLAPGDSVLFGYQPEGGWDYVLVEPGDWGSNPRQYGWVYFGVEGPVCRQYAG